MADKNKRIAIEDSAKKAAAAEPAENAAELEPVPEVKLADPDDDAAAEAPKVPERRRHFKEQFDDEEVKLVFRKHPITMLKGLIFFSVAILIGVIPSLVKPEYSVLFTGLSIGLAIGLITWFPFWVRWYFSVYILTDQRFIQQTRSILQVNVVDIGLDQIQMINYQIKGFNETLLNFGTIVVQTYVGDLVIKYVHHPAGIQKQMVHVLRELGIHPSQRPMTGGSKVIGEQPEKPDKEDEDGVAEDAEAED